MCILLYVLHSMHSIVSVFLDWIGCNVRSVWYGIYCNVCIVWNVLKCIEMYGVSCNTLYVLCWGRHGRGLGDWRETPTPSTRQEMGGRSGQWPCSNSRRLGWGHSAAGASAMGEDGLS